MTAPPDAEAVARLVALLTEAGDKAFNRGDTNDADLYAHAAACVRFVAALDAGEFSAQKRQHGNADEIFALVFDDRDMPVCGPNALAAFRAAQDHSGGSDDGQ